MTPDEGSTTAWLLIIDFALAYFFGRAHGRLAEQKERQEETKK